MMYLVLTALLALQLSNSVLEKFILINKSLEGDIRREEIKNSETLAHISTIVRESGNRESDVEVLKKATNVRKNTRKVIAFIDTLKAELIERTGGADKETGRIYGLKDETEVASLMMNNNKANEIKNLLNGYMEYISNETGKKYGPIALDARDSELFREDPNQASKNFAQLNFEKTPLAAALPTLSRLGLEVVRVEASSLEELARSIGAEDIKFDKIIPIVKPQSNIVVAGGEYKADLLLTASSSGIDPIMSIDGKEITVDNGVGKVSFIASAKNYDREGLAKKTFEAAIKVRQSGGDDTTFTQQITYFVTKPVIQVQAAAVQALYLNCGNELNIQVPILGEQYNPSFTANGATIVPGQGKGLVTVIPKAPEVKLNVYSNNNLLGTQTFKVRTLPKPEIRVTSRGKEVNEKKGIPAPGPTTLELRAIADKSLREFLPKDARYRVAKWEVTLARGSRPLKAKRVDAAEVNLNDFIPLAREGDRLVIEVEKVERLNFRNEIETVEMGTIIHTIPLT
ncbi:MAG: gliding motility protein GldM [Cytophagales bacterium]|nr:gliding motility protein GldM [Cytophagales bacterium]